MTTEAPKPPANVNEHRSVTTRTTVRVLLDIECDGGSWSDNISLAKTHADAIQKARALLARIFKGEHHRIAGDVERVKLVGIDSLDVHVLVKEPAR